MRISILYQSFFVLNYGMPENFKQTKFNELNYILVGLYNIKYFVNKYV